MAREVKNGIYTTGKESFRLSVLDKIVEIYAIDAVPELNLKAGNSTPMNREAFETFKDRELSHYFWLEE